MITMDLPQHASGWDLWFFNGAAKGDGGNVIRGKANWYKIRGWRDGNSKNVYP
ncbi:hypothetical protein [Anaerospora hongkongensis]|uniref:hypothetical protein n=1 Tax=Anaerospora hongkongensis TaxID=244830 RepID=UPI0028A04238|nr:hypothetical protein [Anaerospora hongkongensis]